MLTHTRRALLAVPQGLALALLGVGSIVLFVLAVVSISLIPIGVGLVTTPAALAAVRGYANLRRRLVRSWFGMEIAEPYRPRPAGGPLTQIRARLTDPATGRDLLWMLVDMSGGIAVALFAVGLTAYGPYGFVLARGAWRPIVENDGNEWYAFIHITGQSSANSAAVLGVFFLLAAVALNPAIMRVHARLTRSLLAPVTPLPAVQPRRAAVSV